MALYSDLNQSSPTENALVEDIESVYQSIHNILNTRKKSRLFNLEFGTDIEDVLFDLMDDLTELEVLKEIFEAIDRWEPRVTLNYSKSIVVADIEAQSYDVLLVFAIKGIEAGSFELKGALTKG